MDVHKPQAYLQNLKHGFYMKRAVNLNGLNLYPPLFPFW